MDDHHTPIVSVLMTMYNSAKYLSEAIESVLSSTFKDFEFIIVDDGSKDDSVHIAKGFQQNDPRIKVYVNEINLGDYPNRNRAAGYAKGKYLKYVDSDDKIYAHTLEVMVKGMESNPAAGFAGSSISESVEKLFTPEEAFRTHFFRRGLFDYGPTATIIRRDVFFECGSFMKIRCVSDFDFWYTMAIKYPVLELPKDLIFRREHPDQEIKLPTHIIQNLTHTLPIIEKHLNNPDFPLNPAEKMMILKKFRKRSARNLIRDLQKRKKVKFFISTWRKLRLKVSYIFLKTIK